MSKILWPDVRIDIVLSILKIEFNAPKADSSPVDPKNAFSKSGGW